MVPDVNGRISPSDEEWAVASAVQNMHLMCTAYGLGAKWTTPKFMVLPEVKVALGLPEEGKVMGLMYVDIPTVLGRNRIGGHWSLSPAGKTARQTWKSTRENQPSESMRWVNHYTHPGDTRYQVFVFGEAEHAQRFEHRCTDENIPFEKHEENGEVLFGIAKTHFAKALRANHLVHAEFRTHFIPHRGWRWGLLVFTGTVLALAVLGWLTSSSALGQVEAGMPWELDLVGRVHVPSQVFGMEPTVLEDNGTTATWSPKVGSEFGCASTEDSKRAGQWAEDWSMCVENTLLW